jgi:glycosyltransferase involved in cell wall biosynthesis
VRVAIDARSAVSPGKTGVGYYTWHLVHWLPRVDPETTYVAWYLYARRVQGRPLYFRDVREPNFVERWTPFPSRWWWRLEERYAWPRIEWFVRFDVLFAPNFLPPPTRTKRLVVTVHDLAFRLYPETAPHATRRWLRGIDEALRRAEGVLVPSESTKRDLLDLYPVEPDRVTVTFEGVDQHLYTRPSDEAIGASRAKFGLEAPYFLFVGGIEPRKNLPRLVQAFARTPGDASLVIAGGSVHWNPEGRDLLQAELKQLPADVRRRVILTGYVSDREKAALLGGAMALVYPSLYEGFGLPVVEALAAGTPVLTSTVSSLPEVAGDAALLVDPADVEAIAEAMGTLLQDDALRRRLTEAGPAQAARFTWEDAARRTAAVLRRAGGRA